MAVLLPTDFPPLLKTTFKAIMATQWQTATKAKAEEIVRKFVQLFLDLSEQVLNCVAFGDQFQDAEWCVTQAREGRPEPYLLTETGNKLIDDIFAFLVNNGVTSHQPLRLLKRLTASFKWGSGWWYWIMRKGRTMELLRRFVLGVGAFKGRLEIGGLQGVLIYNIHQSGIDAPRVQDLISQIVLVAWKMPIVSDFFKNLGFSFDDYAIMYHAAVRACPNMLMNNKSLIATFILVDQFSNLDPAFRAYSQAVSDQTGNQRAEGLVTLMTSMVNDVTRYKANELSPIEKYPALTNK